MSDPQPDKPTDRIPRGAIAVVVVGLLLTLAVVALDTRGGGSSAELEWTTTEEVETSPAADFGGKGEFSLRRTTLSAIPPNGGGELIFRVSGAAVVDSAGKKPTSVKCAVTAADPDTTVARTPNLRAAWPRPSDDLLAQEVPESLVLKFNAVGNSILGVPIRDSVHRYTNSASPTLVDWGGYQEDSLGTHSWIWTMDKGTGPGAATLGYAVVFKTSVKPEADINCQAKVGTQRASQKAEIVQQEWPIKEADTDVTGADPSLDVE
ncbi:MAG: hypothetical protein JJE13_07205 [Thermoleophilia bacterium]|nr:hypothetical protein [Thermoleophilia bacterium]